MYIYLTDEQLIFPCISRTYPSIIYRITPIIRKSSVIYLPGLVLGTNIPPHVVSFFKSIAVSRLISCHSPFRERSTIVCLTSEP